MHHLIFQSVYLPMVLHSQIQLKYQTSFNNYFTSIAEKTKVSIDYLHKHFSDFIKDKNQNSFFLGLTNKYEIQNIIPFLNSHKSVGPNSIATRIIKPLKNDISIQLADIFKKGFQIEFTNFSAKTTTFFICNDWVSGNSIPHFML